MLSLHTGYDTGYLTDAVGTGADYYLGAKGEPPGYWQGAGARACSGRSAAGRGREGQRRGDAARCTTRTSGRTARSSAAGSGRRITRRRAVRCTSGSRPRWPASRAERGRFFTPEEERALRLKLRSAYRTVVPFYDYTYSAPKSVSVLWASLLAASAEAEAEGREADAERFAEQAAQVRGAVKRANDRMIAVAERELAYVRTGHHSTTTGEWRDAEGFIVASFEQHDSRDGDPQLHVHNAIANRAQRADGADEHWRALHGAPLFRNKLRMGTLADRFLAQELELIGLLSVLREDGKALEVGGISDEAVDEFSTRSKELRDRARELEVEYEARSRPRSGQAGQVGDQAAGRPGDAGLQGPQPAAGRAAARRVGAQSGAERDRSAVRAPRSSRGVLGGARAERACRARRSGPGSSARPSPRSRPSTRRWTGRS